MEIGKNTIFLSPIDFFTSFSVTSRKKLDQGENIILFLLKLISKKLFRKKGKINTIQHGQGEKHRQRLFSPSTLPAKVKQLIAWPRREKIKTEGEKISYIFPRLKYSAQILSQKKIVFSGKNMI